METPLGVLPNNPGQSKLTSDTPVPTPSINIVYIYPEDPPHLTLGRSIPPFPDNVLHYITDDTQDEKTENPNPKRQELQKYTTPLPTTK